MVTQFQFVPIDQGAFPHAEFFWILEGKASKSIPYHHQIVPRGTCELIFLYKGSFRDAHSGKCFKEGDFIISTQKSILSEYVLQEDFGAFGTCLKAYCLPVFLSVSGTELLNQNFRSDAFKPFSLLRERMIQTQSNDERMSLMFQVIREIGSDIAHFDAHFCSQVNAMSYGSPIEIRSIASDSHVSLRQFQRKFKHLMGYTPSQFLRIARLQPIMDQKLSGSMTQLALTFGFYDQSHFINDFKKITNGLTPKAYFAGKKELAWKATGENVAFFQS